MVSSKPKVAFLSGVTGMDGSHLADLLLEKGYEVHGMIRRTSNFNTHRIDHIFDRLKLHYGNLTDGSRISELLHKIQPDEVYNLGAQSHVRVSFDVPIETVEVVGIGALQMLEAIRHLDKKPRYYQASSSEMFGNSPPPQDENTPFDPRSPYAAAKVLAFHLTKHYREAHNLFATNGILFNHTGERRGATFVTQKICQGAARIKLGKAKTLRLGNLEAKRDFGYAPDYVEMMWMMLQADKPDDFVVATGETHSVREVAELAFECVGLNYKDYVEHDARYERPTEVNCLLGDPSKARKILGWHPKVKFDEIIRRMVEHALKDLR